MKNTNSLFKTLILSSLVFATIITSCKKEEIKTEDTNTSTTTEAKLIKIASGYAIGAATKVELWAKDSLFVGYNNLYIALYDSVSNNLIKEKAKVTISTYMVMGSMNPVKTHSSPYENNDNTTATNDKYPAAAVFTMASSTDGKDYWELRVDVDNQNNNKKGQAKLAIKVKEPSPTMSKVKRGVVSKLDNTTKLLFTLVQPANPKIGLNDLEITVHYMKDMMTFPAITDYTLTINPEMPSMGHGSPNNENPVHSANGHYKGKVNFTMTGDWRINVTVKKGEAEVASIYFDLLF